MLYIQPMKTLIIIPVYNCAVHLEKILQELPKNPGVDILVVDDGSRDNSAQIAVRYGVPYIRHETNRGKGVALKSGFLYAREHEYEAVITMDGDGQHPPALIPEFLSLHRHYPDAVLLGMRKRNPSMPLTRRLSNGISAFLVSKRIHRKIYDVQCGFRLIPLKHLNTKLPQRPGFNFESELLIMLALREVDFLFLPVPTLYPQSSTSKMTYFRTTLGFIFMYIHSFFKNYRRKCV